MAAGPLLARSFRTWLSAKGFWLVVLAAILPLILTGAWVASHQADLRVASFTADRTDIAAGDVVNFTAVVVNDGRLGSGSFNATLGVYALSNGAFVANPAQGGAANNARVDGLAPGESRTLDLQWRATPGVFLMLVSLDKPLGESVDEAGDIPELEERNNYERLRSSATQSGVFVVLPRTEVGTAPRVPADLAGNASATNATNAVVTLNSLPTTATVGQRVNLTATVRNDGPANISSGILRLRVGGVVGDNLVATGANNRSVTFSSFRQVAVGNTTESTISWTATPGTTWVQAFFAPSGDLRDTNVADSSAATAIVVNPTIPPDVDASISEFLEPYTTVPEKATIRSFYGLILQFLQLRLVIPFIALFYAGGIIADERERGNLVYLLTRPLDRWLFPLTKFLASFLVAGVAVVAGVVGTYALLFGGTTTGQDIGYLTTPLLLAVLALFVYGGLFTLLGVLVERPYLWGLGLVIVWEVLATALVPAVRNVTVMGHFINASNTWKLDQGLQWLPEGPDGLRAIQVLLGIGIGSLIAAAVVMKRREFEI